MKSIRVIGAWGGMLLAAIASHAGGFPGWEGMRVIEQEGRPYVLRAADLDGDGRQEMIVVNTRYSRLDVFFYSSDNVRHEPQNDEMDPNTLPMVENVRREEIQLEHLPVDVLVQDLDGRGRPELAILVSPPNRVLIYAYHDSGGWHLSERKRLLEGEVASRRGSMLLRTLGKQQYELLISFDEGIQRLPLAPGSRAAWLTPRERTNRVDWWLADVDGDGQSDLIEQRRNADESICWLRGNRRGGFEPAQVLFDRSISDVQVLTGHDRAQMVLLDSAAQGLIRRYEFARGDPFPLGKVRPLPITGGPRAVWCGMQLADATALIAADPNRPRLIAYNLTESGWDAEKSFPSIGDVVALAAPAAQPGTLLLWDKDGSDLYRSEWDGARLGYPQIWPHSEQTEDRQIVALATTGPSTWWVQRVGSDVDLYRWHDGEDEPSVLRFSGTGSSVESVLWLGGERLLVKDRRTRGLKLVVHEDGKATITQPSHLQRADFDEFRLVAISDELHVARLTNGVLQWLDEGLHPQDQVMLPDGLELADFVADSLNAGWALEKGAPYLHRVEPDASGVAEAVERTKLMEGSALVRNPHLGLIIVARDRVAHVSEGRPQELKLIEILDERSGRSGGVRKTRCHRLAAADLDLDGRDELILCDDRKHRLSVMATVDNAFQMLLAWPVFEDAKYPYEDGGEDLVSEPRAMCGLHFDGDKYPDLALLCHDRLLIYLGREPR